MSCRSLLSFVKYTLNTRKIFPVLTQLRYRSKKAVEAAKRRVEEGLEPIDEFAYNHIEKKNGLIKPSHTVEEQIEYMDSEGINVLHLF